MSSYRGGSGNWGKVVVVIVIVIIVVVLMCFGASNGSRRVPRRTGTSSNRSRRSTGRSRTASGNFRHKHCMYMQSPNSESHCNNLHYSLVHL